LEQAILGKFTRPVSEANFKLGLPPYREQKELLAKGAFTLAQFRGQFCT
jgi:hypothetical protein